jgi:hypothetical protein
MDQLLTDFTKPLFLVIGRVCKRNILFLDEFQLCIFLRMLILSSIPFSAHLSNDIIFIYDAQWILYGVPVQNVLDLYNLDNF